MEFRQAVLSAKNKRNREYFESCWLIAEETSMKIYKDFIDAHGISNTISYGTFISLEPFYVQAATSKDIEMCICKEHLHARSSINTLLNLCELNKIGLDFDSYESFFAYLAKDCLFPDDNLIYLWWGCMPNKNVVCDDITSNWNNLKTKISLLSDSGKLYLF